MFGKFFSISEFFKISLKCLLNICMSKQKVLVTDIDVSKSYAYISENSLILNN